MQPTLLGHESLSRTFKTTHYAEMDRVVIFTYQKTITLSRAAIGAPLTATVDGEEVEPEHALDLLRRAAACEITHDLPAPDDQQPIGKARAHALHRIMGKLGLPSAQHYAIAAAALGEWTPLKSLSTLSRREAVTVWQHLSALYPQAVQVAAQVNRYWRPCRAVHLVVQPAAA